MEILPDSPIIKSIESFVCAKLGGDTTGHDFYHCIRVRKTALLLASHYPGADLMVIACAALLHDVTDVKICEDPEKGRLEIISLLLENGVESEKVDQVIQIIEGISFKGAKVETDMKTIEGKIVQDADRLDALGAIGIARCFAYGGSVGRPIYDPREEVVLHESEEQYRKSNRGSAIGHFYEKLLLLKERMQTEIGRKIAEKRHMILESFLTEFFNEWEGKDLCPEYVTPK
jgi:uncharacterized protein